MSVFKYDYKVNKGLKIGFDTLLSEKYIYLFILKYDCLSYFDKNKIDWLLNYITSYKLLIFHIDRLDIHRQGHATINKLISLYKGNQLKEVHFFYEFPEIFNSINKTKTISVS